MRRCPRPFTNETALQAGADEFLQKPFSRDTVREKFERLGILESGQSRPIKALATAALRNDAFIDPRRIIIVFAARVATDGGPGGLRSASDRNQVVTRRGFSKSP